MTLLGRDEAEAPEASVGTTGNPPSCGPGESEPLSGDFRSRLVAYRVDQLRPHPSYVRHQIAVPVPQLSSLVELGDLVSREPLLIGNVSKAKQLLLHAHPELLQALREGEVSIHRAWIWLQKPDQQLDQLRLHHNLRGITRQVDSLLQAHRHPAGDEPLDVARILVALAAMVPERTASILVAEVEIPGEALLMSAGLRRALTSQGELQQ